MGSPNQGHGEEGDAASWRLRMDSGGFSVPDRFHRQPPPFYARIFVGGSHGAPHARPVAPPDLSFCLFRHFLLFASFPPVCFRFRRAVSVFFI
jgi:hypothetical protein